MITEQISSEDFKKASKLFKQRGRKVDCVKKTKVPKSTLYRALNKKPIDRATLLIINQYVQNPDN